MGIKVFHVKRYCFLSHYWLVFIWHILENVLLRLHGNSEQQDVLHVHFLHLVFSLTCIRLMMKLHIKQDILGGKKTILWHYLHGTLYVHEPLFPGLKGTVERKRKIFRLSSKQPLLFTRVCRNIKL